MDQSIYIMSVAELKKSIELKEIEYREAIKAKKEFREVRNIVDQKKALEKELATKNIKQSS